MKPDKNIKKRQGTFSFTYHPMFERVLKKEEVCKCFLEEILGIEIKSIEHITSEHELNPKNGSRGSRLDILVRTNNGWHDIELQVRKDDDLGRRLRYYQGVVDVAFLEEGKLYSELIDSHIVFICTRDPFKCDIPVYTFDMVCREAPTLDIKCGIRWHVLNSSAFDKADTKSMRMLLEYIDSGIVNPESKLVSLIDREVRIANSDPKWVDDMWSGMTIEEEIQNAEYQARRKGIEQGLEQGIEQGLAQGREQFAKLSDALLDAGRIDDLKRATNDKDYFQTLMLEFGIN